jgi:hypothetical protein
VTSEYVHELYDQLWKLLGENKTFASMVRAGNRMGLTSAVDPGSGLQPFRHSTQDADFPQAILVVTDGKTDVVAKTYEAYLAGPGGHFVLTDQHTFVLTLTMPDLRLKPAESLRLACLATFVQAGLRLKRDKRVMSWGPVSVRRSIVSPSVSPEGVALGSLRFEMTLTLPVTFRLESGELT